MSDITSDHSLFLPSSTLQGVGLSLRLAYLISQDLVGLTPLYRLVFSFLLGGWLSCGGALFTRFKNVHILNPSTYLLVRVYQPDFTLVPLLRSLITNFTFVHHEEHPLSS